MLDLTTEPVLHGSVVNIDGGNLCGRLLSGLHRYEAGYDPDIRKKLILLTESISGKLQNVGLLQK